MLKIRQVMLCLLLLVVSIASAQSKVISGQVTNESDGEPMPGVAISIKGTTNGTISDLDGEYSLNAKEGNTLLFTFIGMANTEVTIGSSSTINVSMASGSINMDEHIVVGYGTTTKEAFTGSAAKIDAEKIESKNASNISQALQGEAAGVQVISGNGQPGSVASIRIRGIGSINGSRAPLYIVDGIPVQGDLNSINPSDIESTTILKDASATAIYGSRGANGVVIITTKKGKSGKSEIEANVRYGTNFRMLDEYDVITSPEEFVEVGWSALKTRGYLLGNNDPAAYANAGIFETTNGLDPYYNMWDVSGDQLIDPATGKMYEGVNRRYNPETWSDEMFQTAHRTEASLKLSGGTEKNRFYTSFNYLNDEGYYVNSDYERITARANIDHEIRTWLKGSMNMNYMHSKSNYAGGQDEDSNNGFWFVANMPSIYPVYARDADGNVVADDVLGGSVYDYGDGTYGNRRFGSLTNALASSTLDVVRSTNNQFTGNANLKATFLKNFSASSTFGAEYLNTSYDNLGNAFYGGSVSQGGSIYKSKTEYLAFTNTNMLKFAKEYDAHHVSAFVAHEASMLEYKNMDAFKSGLANPFGLELDNAIVSSPSGSYSVEYMLLSYFAQGSYDYDGKYFFNGVIRRDGSSRFVNEKWGTFGSVGAAWMVSEEAFMSNISNVLTELKLKTSWGVIGQQAGIGAYSGYDMYSVNNLDDEVSLSFTSKGNADLTWEKTNSFQVGTEFVLFDRISGAVDYYSKNTDDLLFNLRVAPSVGYATRLVNDGKMRNSGIEIQLDAEIVKTNDLNINFGINASFNKNEIVEMPIDDGTGQQKVIDVSGLYGRSAGHSLYDIYTREYVGVDTETGAPLWNVYYTEEGGVKNYIADMASYESENGTSTDIQKEQTSEYADATKLYINKSALPKVSGSFNLNAEYKGFTINALFSYSLGGYGYDSNYASLMHDDSGIGANNWHKDIKNAWKQPGDVTDVPAITSGLYTSANWTSDRFVTSTNYLSLSSINLSYNFNKAVLNKTKLKGLKLFVTADNLWVSSKRQGFYPNTSETGSSSRYQYVPLTSISGGINVKF